MEFNSRVSQNFKEFNGISQKVQKYPGTITITKNVDGKVTLYYPIWQKIREKTYKVPLFEGP